MEIIILASEEDAYAEASSRVVDWIHKKPNAVLGLATGKTMLGVYKNLIVCHKKGHVDHFFPKFQSRSNKRFPFIAKIPAFAHGLIFFLFAFLCFVDKDLDLRS